MKCPNCNYIDGYEWIDDILTDVKGSCGHFVESPVKMEQYIYFGEVKTVRLFACPSCKIAFIEGVGL